MDKIEEYMKSNGFPDEADVVESVNTSMNIFAAYRLDIIDESKMYDILDERRKELEKKFPGMYNR